MAQRLGTTPGVGVIGPRRLSGRRPKNAAKSGEPFHQPTCGLHSSVSSLTVLNRHGVWPQPPESTKKPATVKSFPNVTPKSASEAGHPQTQNPCARTNVLVTSANVENRHRDANRIGKMHQTAFAQPLNTTDMAHCRQRCAADLSAINFATPITKESCNRLEQLREELATALHDETAGGVQLDVVALLRASKQATERCSEEESSEFLMPPKTTTQEGVRHSHP